MTAHDQLGQGVDVQALALYEAGDGERVLAASTAPSRDSAAPPATFASELSLGGERRRSRAMRIAIRTDTRRPHVTTRNAFVEADGDM